MSVRWAIAFTVFADSGAVMHGTWAAAVIGVVLASGGALIVRSGTRLAARGRREPAGRVARGWPPDVGPFVLDWFGLRSGFIALSGAMTIAVGVVLVVGGIVGSR